MWTQWFPDRLELRPRDPSTTRSGTTMATYNPTTRSLWVEDSRLVAPSRVYAARVGLPVEHVGLPRSPWNLDDEIPYTDLQDVSLRLLLSVSHLDGTAVAGVDGTVGRMPYSSALTDEQWALLEPVFNTPGKRGPKHAPDLRRVVEAMLYVSHTGCQWRFLPESFGPWTRVWSQFRRWSRNGTWARALTVLHAAAREADGRAEATPSMVVIDTHLARGASNGGLTFHDRGGPYGRTKGAKRIVAVDVTGLPVGALVVPASTHENGTTELMLEHLAEQGVAGRLDLVLVDRGVTAAAARALGRQHDVELRRVGWEDKQPVFRPIRHAWRVEVAHGRLGRSRRLAKSFENTTTSATGWLQVACVATTLHHLSRAQAPQRALPAAA
jgi:putative transposase